MSSFAPNRTKNDRLFVGKIPLSVDKKQMKELLMALYPEAIEIEFYDGRGFAFLQFKDEHDARIAKERNNGKIEIDGNTVSVKYANKEDNADPTVMSKIANLFVRGFDSTLTEVELREAFGGAEGGIQRCHIERKTASLPFAFILFDTRQQAEAQLVRWNGRALKDSILSVQWARPPATVAAPKYHPYSRSVSVLPQPAASSFLPYNQSPFVSLPLPLPLAQQSFLPSVSIYPLSALDPLLFPTSTLLPAPVPSSLPSLVPFDFFSLPPPPTHF